MMSLSRTCLTCALIISFSSVGSCAVITDPQLPVRPIDQLPLEKVTVEQISELASLMKISLKTRCYQGVCTTGTRFDITSKSRDGVLHITLTRNSADSAKSSLIFLVEYPQHGVMLMEDVGLDGKVDTFMTVDFSKNEEGVLSKEFSLCYKVEKPDACTGAQSEPDVAFRDGLYGVSVLRLKELLKILVSKTSITT